MAVTKVGLVSYVDDGKVFRKVFPTVSDSELDDRRWVKEGCNPARTAIMQKVRKDSPEAAAPMTGKP